MKNIDLKTKIIVLLGASILTMFVATFITGNMITKNSQNIISLTNQELTINKQIFKLTDIHRNIDEKVDSQIALLNDYKARKITFSKYATEFYKIDNEISKDNLAVYTTYNSMKKAIVKNQKDYNTLILAIDLYVDEWDYFNKLYSQHKKALSQNKPNKEKLTTLITTASTTLKTLRSTYTNEFEIVSKNTQKQLIKQQRDIWNLFFTSSTLISVLLLMAFTFFYKQVFSKLKQALNMANQIIIGQKPKIIGSDDPTLDKFLKRIYRLNRSVRTYEKRLSDEVHILERQLTEKDLLLATSFLQINESLKSLKEYFKLNEDSFLNNKIDQIMTFSQKILSMEKDRDEAFVPINTTNFFEEQLGPFKNIANLHQLDFNFKVSDDLPNDIKVPTNFLQKLISFVVSYSIENTDKGQITIYINKVVSGPKEYLSFDLIDDESTNHGIRKKNKKFISDKRFDISFEIAYFRAVLETIGGDIDVINTSENVIDIRFSLPLISDEAQLDVPELNLLIVDDCTDNLDLLKNFYRSNFKNIDTATNGKEALEKFKNNDYDLILMDIQMPVMNGLKASKEIRKIEAQKNLEPTKIVAITKFDKMDGMLQRCESAGITSIYPKPIKKHSLINKINEVVAGAA